IAATRPDGPAPTISISFFISHLIFYCSITTCFENTLSIFSGCPLSLCLSNLRDKHGNPPHILFILIPEGLDHLHLFPSRQAVVYKDKDRKHYGRYDSRPLDKHPDHDNKESGILRVSHIGIRPLRYQAVLCTVDQFPALPHDCKTDKGQTVTDNMNYCHHQCPAAEKCKP